MCGVLGYAFVAFAARAQAGATGATEAALTELLDTYSSAKAGFALVALASVAIGSICFIMAVAPGRSAFPRRMAWCSPLSLLVVLGLGIRLVPTAALILAPTALNLSHLVFFAVATATLWPGKFTRLATASSTG